jgi:TM2 domain-containing membrane protein YozV
MNMPPQKQYGPPPGYMPQKLTFSPGTPSPLNMFAVSLLCFFFGFLGIHRFYMGKIKSGILMILTLGGLGIWSLIDLILAMSGRFHDKNGLPINLSRPINTVLIFLPIILLFLLYLFYIIFILVAGYREYSTDAKDTAAQSPYPNVVLALEDYLAKYEEYTDDRERLMDSAAQSAYHNVALAEEAYFAKYGKYTDDLEVLRNYAGLTMDSNVEYRDLIWGNNRAGETCFEFKVKHKDLDSGYKYASCAPASERVTTYYD